MEAANNTQRCAGTREMKIEGNALPGMMAVFTDSNAEASHEGNVRVLVTDGHDSFEGTVQVCDVKGLYDSTTAVEEKVNVLTVYLLDNENNKERPSITILLKPDQRTIRLTMNKRTGTGINRQILSTVLTPPTPENGSISFCRALVSAFQQEKMHVNQLEEELKKARVDVAVWKDAHAKVDQAKQNREDELLAHFLELYGATHKKLKETEQQLQRASSLVAVAAPSNIKAPSKRVARSKGPKSSADDDEVEIGNDETPETTATTTRRRRTAKADLSDEVSVKDEPNLKRRRNQLTDIKENSEANSDEKVPAKKGKKPPATRKGRSAKESKKDDEKDENSNDKIEKMTGKSTDQDLDVIDRTVEVPASGIEKTGENNADVSTADSAPDKQAVTVSTDAMAVDDDLDDDWYIQWAKDLRKKGGGS